MFTLSYTIATGHRVTQEFDTRAAAEAEAAAIGHAMREAGMSAHTDGIIVAEVEPAAVGIMHVITVTIGRNVGDTPMSLTLWEQFIEDVKADMLHAVPSDLAEIHRGVGVWDGVEEESAKLTLLRHAKPSDDMLAELRAYLSENARHYGQDAIALTLGKSELV